MPHADYVDVSSVLKGKTPTGSRVTVRGWVRTRRDSKAGLSFIHVHDGSCFDPLQVVASSALPNYDAEIKKLTSGCSVIATRRADREPGTGTGRRTPGRDRRGRRVGGRPGRRIPIQPKRTSFEYLREVAHLRPRTNTLGAVARVRHCLSMAIHRYFHEHGFFWVHTPIVTASDAEGAGEMFRVSTLDLANLGAIPRTQDGRTDFSKDFFGKEAFLTVSGQLNVETYCLRAVEGLHVRPDVPRREQQHQPPPRRVLDGGARDRVRRSGRRRRPRRIVPEIHPRRSAERARRRHEVLRRSHRQGVRRARRSLRHVTVRAHDLHRRDRGAREERQDVRVPRPLGHGSAVGARALADRGVRQGARSS